MQYIVRDLEWNQPISYHSPAFRSVGGKLRFEMIQIGAVKVDESFQVVDSFSQLIQPQHYVRLHPRISRITHITQDDLADAPDFNEAMAAFADWCGEDYVLLTWGCDDISVLNQTMLFFKCETTLSKIYDAQKLFSDVTGTPKERKGLKAAMEMMEIVPDEENMPFHNAVNDAYYTALVFAKMPEPAKVLEYPLTARKLQHLERAKKESTAILRVRSSKDALKSPAAMNPPCPVCGKRMEVPEGYVRQRGDQFMALADCPQHGLAFVKIALGKNEEGKRIMTRSSSLADEQSPAYVHTKHLQWAQKMALQQENE
jgi:DNA polymerase III epsilon subunit-like protein